jgi:hypothetical protein
MIRTRDFFLFLLVSGFLIVAIVVTVVWSYHARPINSNTAVNFYTHTATYTTEVATQPDTKNDRLAELRKKLAEDTSISAPETPIEPVITASTSEETITAPAESSILLCNKTYSPKTIAGLTGSQQYEERDGQRVFFTTTAPLDPATTSPAIAVAEQIVFTLPLRTTPLSTESCIKDDIVAVSQTGMVIRNTDYAKYQGSGESTLIGYTIDGFPLYGRTNSIATDDCGGAMIDGSYRYYLSAERKGVIGCFAGIPAAL